MTRPFFICLASFSTALAALPASAAEDSPAPRIFRMLDQDGDGKIVASEVNKSPWVARLDQDKDGGVSAKEFEAGWGEFAELRGVLAARFPQVMGYPGAKAEAEALESPRQGAKVMTQVEAAEAGVGRWVPDLEVAGLDGKAVRLANFGAGKTLVVACVSSSCPVGKRYFPTLAALEKEFAGKGVAFLLVGTTKTDTDLRAALDAAGVKAPCVRDLKNVLLKTLGATASTDVFVIDARRTLQYRGAIDDQYGLGYSLEAPRTRLLAQALDAVLAGKTPPIVATVAPGCELDLSDAVSVAVATTNAAGKVAGSGEKGIGLDGGSGTPSGVQSKGAGDPGVVPPATVRQPSGLAVQGSQSGAATGVGKTTAGAAAPGAAANATGAVNAAAAGATAAPVTFHNRISRILQQNCQECHRTGGVAPFPLVTYEDVKEHAGMVRKMVEQRLMPPWFAAPPAKGGHSPWSNDRTLPERDRADLLAWLGSGRALGEEKDAPLPRQWGDGEWAIGKPDAIFQIPQPIEVKATGTMPYQQVRVPTNFAETRYVSAIEVLPTARDVVHHVLVFADVTRPGARLRQLLQQGQTRERTDEEEGGFLAIYVPGNNTLVYPEGFGKAVPANATLRFQIHYTPNGKATQDQVRVGMKFCQGTPENVVLNHGIANRRFTIPAGADNHEVTARLPVPAGVKVLAFLPHMHLRGKAWRYEATLPDGTKKTLLDVPRYDFNWQLLYRYAEPFTLPAGSIIQATGWFDNSAGNPANPDPTKPVRWGAQTYEEMMLGYIEYYHPRGTAAVTKGEAGGK